MALALNTIVTGEPTARPPLVIAHGLFGSARNWGTIAKRLSADRQVLAVDMRNHGDSPWDATHSYEAMADDLAGVIEGAGGRAAVLGHSMGGKASMTLALTRPELVDRLIVADVAPVAYRHDQLQYIAAMRGVDLARVKRRADAEAMLAERVDDPVLRGFFLQNVRLSPDGASWRINLAALEDQMPAILGFPETGAVYDGPALFVTGERSDYMRADDWPRVIERFPKARRIEIAEAGHWLHAEAPEAFLAAISEFLAS